MPSLAIKCIKTEEWQPLLTLYLIQNDSRGPPLRAGFAFCRMGLGFLFFGTKAIWATNLISAHLFTFKMLTMG